MDKMPRLRQRLSIALLTLLFGSGTLTLWAQEQQEPVEPVPPEQRETQDAANTPVNASAETDADDTPATTSAEAEVDNSPFDYQSSEKISEDLSVSFPVDI